MATEKQIESLKKAREARALKKELGIVDKPSICVSKNDVDVWLQALIATMHIRVAAHPSHIASCIPVADEVLKVYKEKFA